MSAAAMALMAARWVLPVMSVKVGGLMRGSGWGSKARTRKAAIWALVTLPEGQYRGGSVLQPKVIRWVAR